MRKRLGVAPLALGAIVILAAGAVFAKLRSGYYDSEKAGSIEQSMIPLTTADANYGSSSFPSFTPELAEGEGRQEVQSFCVTCHSQRYITMQPPLPATTWEAEVNKMMKTYGAAIPEATAKKISLYLGKHYAPENRKQ
jgi:hypothetical protein